MNCAICGQESHIIRSNFSFCSLHHAQVEQEIERMREAGERVNIGRIVLTLRGESIHDYVLRDIPGDLWKAVKVHAAQEGRPIRDIILEALRRIVK